MKILEINKFFFEKRGAERHFFDLCRLLEERGHEVAVFAMRHPENIASPWERYFVSRVGYNPGDAVGLWSRLVGVGRLFWSCEARTEMRKLLQDFAPDIVHVHNAYHQLSLSFFPLIRQAGIPLLLTAHDYAAISPDKDAYYPEVGRRYWKFLRIKKYSLGKRCLLIAKKYWEDASGFYDAVDRFIVPSRFVAQAFEAAGIDPKRIVKLPHFIPENQASSMVPSAAELPERFILYFGAMTEGKGVAKLSGIAEQSGVPLVAAGRIDEDFDRTSCPGTIFIGPRTPGELRYLIEHAACVASASSLAETFGLTALETIALGKPFFALRSGAVPEIIQNGFNGYAASDIHELEMLIRDFLEGKISVAEEESIASAAAQDFGALAYAERFERLVTEIITVK